jgi:NAD(P)-dependent dehydrogenase (short-subunit alcohol dehydrogenase family)
MASERGVALVTGAGAGIGAGVALALARDGWDVAVTGRSPEPLSETVAEIEKIGARGLAWPADVRSPGAIADAVAEVERRLGPVQALVNNAGIQRLSAAADVTEADWDDVLDTNLKGAFFCAQAVGRGMLARGSGAIVNIASAAALVAVADRAAYAASKAGLVMLTKVLALEWAPRGVRVNAVAPTFVDTALGRATLDQSGSREKIIGRIPLGRLAEITDVVAATRFLLSAEASGFITGHVLTVDGGLSL